MQKGFLPVYSVSTEDEAQSLIIATCTRGYEDGQYYAPELIQEQTLENLAAFSNKLDRAHDRLIENGHCHCREPARAVKRTKRKEKQR